MFQRLFQITFYILGTFAILVAAVTTLVFFVQCVPIRAFWEHAYLIANIQSPHLAKGHCLSARQHNATTIIMNTIVDVTLLTLPAIGLWKLSLPRAKKVGIFVAFSLGALYVSIPILLPFGRAVQLNQQLSVVFVGAFRIYYGYRVTDTTDISCLHCL